MFIAGCGADQNPLPRRTVELARDYGRQLAQGVEAVLGQSMTPIEGELASHYEEIHLSYANLPTREQLEATAQSDNRFEAGRARTLLQQWQRSGDLAASYSYPIQTWHFGSGPIWVVMGGEVVVDYAIRVRQEFGDRFWTAGYANDVMAYIPSRRVLLEGGYEGGGAMLYYGLPSAWDTDVEQKIMQVVERQAAP